MANEALATAALDAACALIQNALGVKTGDTAAIFFSDDYFLRAFKYYIRMEQILQERG